jgi:hypothetical protein
MVMGILAALSLTTAFGLAIVLTRLLREDRERSEARVAALELMAQATVPTPAEGAETSPSRLENSKPSLVSGTLVASAEPRRDLDLRPNPAGGPAAAGLFAERSSTSPWKARFAVIATLTLAAVLLTVIVGGRRSSRSASSTAAAAPVREAVPLELVSLRHSSEAQGLTISGVVRNPKNGGRVLHLVATAFVFGADGGFLTSGRAPVERTNLGPGEESPFVVPVPVNGQASRYRVGFRTEDGHVLTHIDKRTVETFASKQELP